MCSVVYLFVISLVHLFILFVIRGCRHDFSYVRARDLWGARPVRVSSVRAMRTPVRLWERTIVCTRVHACVCTIAISSSSFITPHRLQNRVVAYELSRHIDYIMTKGNHCKQQAMGQSPSVGCYARTHARVRARAHTRTQTRTHSCTHEHACMQHHMAHKSQKRTALMPLTLCCCLKMS